MYVYDIILMFQTELGVCVYRHIICHTQYIFLKEYSSPLGPRMGILGSGWNQVQVCLYKCVSKGNIQKPVYSFIGSPHVHSPKEPRVSQWRPWNLRNEERLRCFRNGWMPGKPNIIPKRSKIVGVKCYRNWSILGHKKSSETLRVLGVNLETQELLIFFWGGGTSRGSWYENQALKV